MVNQDSKHYKKAVKKAVRNISSISKSGKPVDIADIIISSYEDFGDDFLNLAKREKVLLNYSSIDDMELIFSTIFEKLNQTNIKTRNDNYYYLKQFLYQHHSLVASKVMIQYSLENKLCWGISRDLALMGIAAEIYSQLIYINNGIEKLDNTQSSLAMVQNLQGTIRNLHECGAIVLKEALRRNLPKSTTHVENCHWNEILNLADKKHFLQIMEDRYSYFDWNLLINHTNEFQMVVCRPKSFELENALHYSDYRSNSLDLAKHKLSSSDTEMTKSDISKKVIDSIKVDEKIDFDLLLKKMDPEIETYVQTHMDSMRQIIEESHLAIIQKSPEFESDLFPVISAWKCLFRLCFLRKLALDELLKEKPPCQGLLTFILSKQEIYQYFKEFGELDIESAKFASNMLIFKPDVDSVRTYDPYKQPLILLEDDKILLLETYIQNSRILRNSLKLLTLRDRAQLDKCGPSLEISFQEILQLNQFKTNKGQKVKILDSNGKVKTDLDVLAYRDGVLFLGQVKNVLPPGNLYETYRILEILEHAGDQLHVCIDNLDANMDKIKHLLGIKKDDVFNIEKVVACILTNDITFGGYEIDDFMVLDLANFKELLKDVEIDKSYPEALIVEFEKHWGFHKTAYVNMMVYYEVEIGDIIFLCPGLPLVPITDY